MLTAAPGQAPTSSFSIWKFTSFRDGGNFSLAISHHFSDPTHYPPPYSYVQYFGDVDLTPECSTYVLAAAVPPDADSPIQRPERNEMRGPRPHAREGHWHHQLTPPSHASAEKATASSPRTA